MPQKMSVSCKPEKAESAESAHFGNRGTTASSDPDTAGQANAAKIVPPVTPTKLYPNLPSPEGAALGQQLARLCAAELAEMKKRFPNHKEPCGTCAFRLGTIPNQCSATVMDAFKCLMEQNEFRCHETKGCSDLCTGWLILARKAFEGPPIKADWEYSYRS